MNLFMRVWDRGSTRQRAGDNNDVGAIVCGGWRWMQRWGRIPGRRTCRRNQSRDEERRGECLASIRDHWIQHLDVGGSALVLGDRFSISPRQSSKTLAVGDGTRPIISALELISGQRESTGSRSGTGSAGSSASASAECGIGSRKARLLPCIHILYEDMSNHNGIISPGHTTHVNTEPLLRDLFSASLPTNSYGSSANSS